MVVVPVAAVREQVLVVDRVELRPERALQGRMARAASG